MTMGVFSYWYCSKTKTRNKVTLDEIISEVAKEKCMTKEFVKKVYLSYWRAIREHISSLPLKEDLTDEKFLELQPNVNIPSIGKLYITLDRYKRMKDYYHNRTKKEE